MPIGGLVVVTRSDLSMWWGGPLAGPEQISLQARRAEVKQGIGSEALTRFMEPVATAIEMFGVAIIAISVVVSTIKFALDFRGAGSKQAYNSYRANLGRGILLGLELLVGADIIATVTAPLTWQSVGLLAIIVLIRTFLSFALETEIEGRWPWRRSTATGDRR